MKILDVDIPRVSGEMVRTAALLVILIVGALPFILDANMAGQKISYLLTGKPIDCGQVGDPYDPSFHADLAVVLGSSLKWENGQRVPDEMESDRLDAAAMLYAQGKADRVHLAIGPRRDTPFKRPEVRYLQNRVREFSWGLRSLPVGAVSFETWSKNTWQNLDGAASLGETGSVVVFTSDFHEERAQIMAGEKLECANVVGAESYLSRNRPEWKPRYQTKFIDRAAEWVKIAISLWNPDFSWITSLAMATR